MVCAPPQGMGAPEHTLLSIANILLLFTASSSGQAGEQAEERVQARRRQPHQPSGKNTWLECDITNAGLCQGMPLKGKASQYSQSQSLPQVSVKNGEELIEMATGPFRSIFATEHKQAFRSLETLKL